MGVQAATLWGLTSFYSGRDPELIHDSKSRKVDLSLPLKKVQSLKEIAK